MTGGDLSDGHYSVLAGFAFAFNVIMGNGPLALPAAFQQAGWLISVIVLIVLCFTSFITFTFVVEAMSISNAVLYLKSKFVNSEENDPNTEDPKSDSPVTFHSNIPVPDATDIVVQETTQNVPEIVRSFEITEKFELARMFGIYFGRLGNILFYLNICIYLYGDLSIYAAGVPKSLRNVACTAFDNQTELTDSDLCWDFSRLTRMDVYRCFVMCFAALMLPFLFFHVTKSRWLQLVTTLIRWLSFLLMLCLAIDRAVVVRELALEPPSEWKTTAHSWNPAMLDLGKNRSTPLPVPNPPIVRAQGIPALFGVCVYVFMCHHSVPGFVTPIRNKHRLMIKLYLPLFLSCLICNLLLSGTALAAFVDIKDLYTLNFVPNRSSAEAFKLPFELAQVFGYFLALFPVFALSSTFPILACTLLGNLNVLFHMFAVFHSRRAQNVLRWTLPFIVLLPPVCIALGTDNIGFLVGFTGAIAGSGIQYIIPAVLVYKSRVYFTEMLDKISASNSPTDETAAEDQLTSGVAEEVNLIAPGGGCRRFREMWQFRSCVQSFSKHASPFQHFAWIFFLLIWSAICLVIVLIDKIHPF